MFTPHEVQALHAIAGGFGIACSLAIIAWLIAIHRNRKDDPCSRS